MAPVLQDGWLLTSMNGSSDSGGAAVVQALASLAGTAVTGGAGKAATAATPKSTPPSQAELKAFGLTSAPTGPITKLDFASQGLARAAGQAVGQNKRPPPDLTVLQSVTDATNVAVFFAALITAATATTVEKQEPPTWGNSVLNAGLYAFQYADDDYVGIKKGEFVGLRAIVYFCNGGLTEPTKTTTIDGTPYSLSRTPCAHKYIYPNPK
jgi:hypothetical protein